MSLSNFYPYNLGEFTSASGLTMLPQNANLHHYDLQSIDRLGTGLVGRPIHFTEGQFAGRTIRATLQEMQAPVFGRKTVSTFREAQVDRRPLDPPPVAWLRLFEILNLGTTGETLQEVNYDNIDTSGLMCTVDLLPVPSHDFVSSAFERPASSTPLLSAYHSPTPHRSQLQVNNALFVRSPQKATAELAGTTFVQADSIPWKGRTCLLFHIRGREYFPSTLSDIHLCFLLEQDLAVRIEGVFLLQYRFFDIFSIPRGHTDPPIQAECCGVPFRIYSTKVSPRLGRSTELCKHLARYGVRLNVRETERKRKYNDRDVSPPFTTRVLQDLATSESTDE
ncbi:Velvet domain-containing protein [Mycena venus]|uniref:Velvet domain-containing protein n=1 Tax=Mycena venus TaxID=2733690 RepID=A0A8H6Y4H7_9AGAR|nr:Velvet domain-containing protein [Mycena venus]